ncbi:MAG: fatty acid desaturase family protein [Chthoniobacterales bacterium]
MIDMSTTAIIPDHVDEPHWVTRAAFPILSIALVIAQIAMGFALYHGHIWLVVLLVPVVSHLMHGQLIGFHEASHGLLRKSRSLNDFDGQLIGIFSFMPFTLYRATHQTHHMHLASERDEELWPFVVPRISRGRRVLFAFLELSAGIIFTSFLFFRTFFRRNSPIRAPKVRRRIWKEIALIAVVWSAIVVAVTWWHVWPYFLCLFLIPAVIAANLQSWRKYIEHVGMTGHTPNSATRSIVCRTWLGNLVAFTLLHEPYHGVHHELSGVGHADLPRFASALEPKTPGDVPPFPSYRHAFLHLLRSLGNPRVGAQWRDAA